MSQPMTFLAVTVAGWTALRIATAGLYPGAFAQASASEAPLSAMAQIEAPLADSRNRAPSALETLATSPSNPVDRAEQFSAARRNSLLGQPAHRAPARNLVWHLPVVQSMAPVAAPSLPEPAFLGAAAPTDRVSQPPARRFDRWQATGWAMWRGGNAATSPSLASGGTLGGSQAGARLLWRYDERLALSARLSGSGGNIEGGEAALGVRFTPFPAIPLAITAERRQRLGSRGGRNDFALFAEGGMWDQPIAQGFEANGYLQAGVVGVEQADAFVDGSITLTRPLIASIDGGVGVWGGAQPGLSRLDIGPRLSLPLYDALSLHLDWRHQVAGNAEPGSGPVVSIGADF